MYVCVCVMQWRHMYTTRSGPSVPLLPLHISMAHIEVYTQARACGCVPVGVLSAWVWVWVWVWVCVCVCVCVANVKTQISSCTTEDGLCLNERQFSQAISVFFIGTILAYSSVCACMCEDVCLCVCMCASVCGCVCAALGRAQLLMCARMYVCMYVCVCACVCVCVCVCVSGRVRGVAAALYLTSMHVIVYSFLSVSPGKLTWAHIHRTLGYILVEVPSNLVLKRVRPSFWYTA
jgi:hypothetical protein